ncbi:Sodium-dependent phosphate transport protein 2A, partial [Aphelenchoides avenae]
YRWFALVYIFTLYIATPASLLLLTLLPPTAMMTIVCSFLSCLITLATINWLQAKHPGCLPGFLRTWNFLPIWFHSLEPYDHVLSECCGGMPFFSGRFIRPRKPYVPSRSPDSGVSMNFQERMPAALTPDPPRKTSTHGQTNV